MINNSLLPKYKNIPVQMRATFWFLVISFVNKGMNAITVPILTRVMSVEEFGYYNVYNSWYGILTVVVSLNLSSGVFVMGLIKNKCDRENYVSAAQWLTNILVIIWVGIILIFSEKISVITGLALKYLLLLLINIWLSSAYGFWAAQKRVDYELRKYIPLTVGAAIFSQVVGVICAIYFTERVTAKIVGSTMVYSMFYGLLLFKNTKFAFEKKYLFYWRSLLKFNIPLVPHYLSQTILNSSDKIMIERINGRKNAGIYSLSYSIAQLMTVLNSAITQALEPWLYKLIENNEIDIFEKTAYLLFEFVAFCNLLLMAFAPELVNMFAPLEYKEAVYIIPLISESVFFSFMFFFFSIFEYYLGKTKQIAYATLFAACLNIILNYYFIPRVGYFAAGYTTLVCFIIYTSCHFVFMRIAWYKVKKQILFSVKKCVVISLVFMICSYIMQLAYKNTLIRYNLIVVMFFILFRAYKKNKIDLCSIIKNIKR